MKSKWNEMSKEEKVLYVVYCVLCVVTAIFALADFSNDWKYSDVLWMISVSLLLAVECKTTWNKNRKFALIELAGGVIMLISGIVSAFI